MLRLPNKLQKQAVDAGAKRLIFLSSIKVNGENTYDNYDVMVKTIDKKNIFT